MFSESIISSDIVNIDESAEKLLVDHSLRTKIKNGKLYFFVILAKNFFI